MANHQSNEFASSNLVVSFKKRRHDLGGGQSVHFSLVATRDLQINDEVTFSYNSDDDAEPICDYRWLIEYGFLPSFQDPRPQRDCHIFNLSSTTVASVASGLGGSSQVVSRSSMMVKLDGTGQVHKSAVDFISLHSGPPPLKFQNADRDAWLLTVFVRCLEEEEREMLRAKRQAGIDGVNVVLYELFLGSIKAVQVTIILLSKSLPSML